jgi:hypothetical protein
MSSRPNLIAANLIKPWSRSANSAVVDLIFEADWLTTRRSELAEMFRSPACQRRPDYSLEPRRERPRSKSREGCPWSAAQSAGAIFDMTAPIMTAATPRQLATD